MSENINSSNKNNSSDNDNNVIPSIIINNNVEPPTSVAPTTTAAAPTRTSKTRKTTTTTKTAGVRGEKPKEIPLASFIPASVLRQSNKFMTTCMLANLHLNRNLAAKKDVIDRQLDRKLFAIDNRIGRTNKFMEDVQWRSTSPPAKPESTIPADVSERLFGGGGSLYSGKTTKHTGFVETSADKSKSSSHKSGSSRVYLSTDLYSNEAATPVLLTSPAVFVRGPIDDQPPARLLTRREYTGLTPGEALLMEMANEDSGYKSILRPKAGFQDHIKSRVKAVQTSVASMRHDLEFVDKPPDWNINYGKPFSKKRFCSKLGIFPG